MIRLWHGRLRDWLTTWAADPRTTPALLRRALDDVVACEALAPSESDSLKAGYLDVSSCSTARKPGPPRAAHAVPPVLESGLPAQPRADRRRSGMRGGSGAVSPNGVGGSSGR